MPRRSVAIAALLAVGCGGESRPAGDAPLVLGYSVELQGLNPVLSTDQNANELIDYLLFTTLVRYDEEYRIAPGLAQSWTLGPSGVVFRLHEDLRWHDGAPVTAEDVAFTFRLAKDPAAASPLAAAYLSNVTGVEVLGPHAVRFTFDGPHSQPLEDFFWAPVPAHLLSRVPAAELARQPFNRRPVGNGPYRFVSWSVNQQLVFEANPDYPLSLGGPPAIRRIVYRIIPESTSLLAELLSGGIHVDGPVSPADAPKIERAPGVRLFRFPWRQFSYIGWNGRRPLFSDARVRRALTMAIDRQAILESVLEGFGRPAVGMIPPWHPYAPDLEPLPFDPDSASALLRAAGWSDSDGDGVLDRAGRPFRFELLANQRSPVYGDMVQIIQAQLKRVGIDAVPRLLEWQTLLGLHRRREFDAVLTNWVLDNFRVDPRVLFHGSQAALPSSANRSSYSNPRADSLMDLGVRTMDPAEASRIWLEFSEIIQNDQPLTFLFWQDELAGVSRKLAGVRMDARGELVNVPQWRWRRPDAPPEEASR
ncbi:MAG: ABC transporter substrate-binding protein [Gemmatimonadota bacterium]